MAHLVKTKTSIALFSLVIVVFIPLLRSNFYRTPIIKRWTQLTWDDFNGIVKPFTGYGAVIHSKVYLEYDSVNVKYHAYAAQNNMRSWAKASMKSYEAGLRHEQYHFNITEYHARLLNEQLSLHAQLTEDEANELLNKTLKDLNAMQSKYDTETDHSLISYQQDYWEYKIDSLLQAYSGEDGIVTDLYTGLQAWFPTSPNFYTGINENGTPYRLYELNRYGMNFIFVSFQTTKTNFKQWHKGLISYYEGDSIRIDSMITTQEADHMTCKVISTDTSANKRISHVWQRNGSYEYKVTAQFTLTETGLYEHISNSFLSSVTLVNTDSLWSNRELSYSEIVISHNATTVQKPNSDNLMLTYCYNNSTDHHLFYKEPFRNENGDLYIIYDILNHQDSLIRQNFVMINQKDLIDFPVDSINQILLVPAELLDSNSELAFGYFLKEDSAKDCYWYYKESIELTGN